MSSSSMYNGLMKDSSENRHHHEEHEESSGWTYYLKDFSGIYSKEDSFISTTSPSLVSDAAWNGSDHVHINHVKRLSFKNLSKSDNKKYDDDDDDDDDLEDTASSPVNSPKVSRLKQMEVNNTRDDDVSTVDFPGKQTRLNNFSRHDEEENTVKFDARNVNEYVDLKKKGLCLVPMSALVNYFG